MDESLDDLWRLGPPPEGDAEPLSVSPDGVGVEVPLAPLLAPFRLSSVLVEAPRVTDGAIALTRIGKALGWGPGEYLSGALVPDAFAVVLRSPDHVIADAAFGSTNATAEQVDSVLIGVESRHRLRLGAGVLGCLGVERNAAQILAFASEMTPWAVLLIAPGQVEPRDWRGWLTW